MAPSLRRRVQGKQASSAPGAISPAHEAEAAPIFVPTFQGQIVDETDARLLIEACIAGAARPIYHTAHSFADLPLPPGTVVVLAEGIGGDGGGGRARWRDGKSWGPSRNRGPFLEYTEVRSDPRMPVLFKSTITLPGSDSAKYRVISYFERLEPESACRPSKRAEFVPFASLIQRIDDRVVIVLPGVSATERQASRGSKGCFCGETRLPSVQSYLEFLRASFFS
ncbi:hypothetical protein BC830DRAFT_1143946 [Chytriomyces sp. MP71]|nr:hypothetical protein BC830DRAFT_1143946 [Chytriomyces sp. MP71]